MYEKLADFGSLHIIINRKMCTSHIDRTCLVDWKITLGTDYSWRMKIYALFQERSLQISTNVENITLSEKHGHEMYTYVPPYTPLLYITKTLKIPIYFQ